MQLLEHKQVTLKAVINRLIPGDDFPSGWEAGVGDYRARQWQGELREQLSSIKTGLDWLDAEAKARYEGKAFASLAAEQQDILLQDIEKGELHTLWGVPPAQFLARLANLAA